MNVGGGSTLTLQGVLPSQLDARNFLPGLIAARQARAGQAGCKAG